ncbi:S41 family peptidase [Rubrolithibacter danxiaensis]|uniref:S41 family peptidase n=1 Tax=Rubrolithibacter danxiaensis TaxID=3390805 RepID=UPI003BF84763
MRKKYLLSIIGILAFSLSTLAQLSEQKKKETIDNTLKIIHEKYVFPEVAGKMENHIRKLEAKNVYRSITDGNEFAKRLTQDLRDISKDLHLNMNYSEELIPEEAEREIMSIPASEREGFGRMLKHTNYGLRKLDVLKGNIGYIDVDIFCDPAFSGDTYAAAMNYIAHTDALIIDLRNCVGSSSPDAIPFLCSYFFESPVHLTDWYWRKGNSTKQSWTYAYVPGKKYLNKPVYILISRNTFSGAEELAYDLKNLKRATIIGERTGGGANPGGYVRVNDHFNMFIPIGKAINPITKTNWEGVGVEPDSAINPRLALYKARQLAMKHTIATTDEAVWKNALSEWVKELKDDKPVLKTLRFELKGYPNAKEVFVAGSFNDWADHKDKLARKGDSWVLTTQSEPGKIKYKFIVDGEWITDPANSDTEKNGPNIDSVKILD